MPIFSIVLHIGHNIKHYQIKQCLTSMSQGYKEGKDQSLCDQEPLSLHQLSPGLQRNHLFQKSNIKSDEEGNDRGV